MKHNDWTHAQSSEKETWTHDQQGWFINSKNSCKQKELNWDIHLQCQVMSFIEKHRARQVPFSKAQKQKPEDKAARSKHAKTP